MPIRVLVADDHAIVRLGVIKLIELLGGGEIAVVGEVADGDGLLDAVAALSPDVLLLILSCRGSTRSSTRAGWPSCRAARAC